MSKDFSKRIKESFKEFEASKTKEGKKIIKDILRSYKYDDAITFAQKVAIGLNDLRMLEINIIDEKDLKDLKCLID